MLLSAHRQYHGAGTGSKVANANVGRVNSRKRRVRFTDIAASRHVYAFDWELEAAYWYSRTELKSFGTVRFDDADVLREERGILTSSRDDADDFSGSRRGRFISDQITHALDDEDDNHEISVRGIEHFVFPVLQKEMVQRKKDLKRAVLGYSRDPKMRRLDPLGIKLGKESEKHSKWARDVASERGIKYCQMKRGLGQGGGLLQISHNARAQRRFSALECMEEDA